MTKINCSNFSYYICNAKKAKTDLDSEAQKKLKVYQGLLACTLGVGHAVCGIVYLIKRSCDKGSKTNQVGQKQLNPTSNTDKEDIKLSTNFPKTFEKIRPYFMEKIKTCIDAFEKELPLNKLSEIRIEHRINEDDPHVNDTFEITKTFNKKELLKFIDKKIDNLSVFVLDASAGAFAAITFEMLSKEEKGHQTNVHTSLFVKNKNFFGESLGRTLKKSTETFPSQRT